MRIELVLAVLLLLIVLVNVGLLVGLMRSDRLALRSRHAPRPDATAPLVRRRTLYVAQPGDHQPIAAVALPPAGANPAARARAGQMQAVDLVPEEPPSEAEVPPAADMPSEAVLPPAAEAPPAADMPSEAVLPPAAVLPPDLAALLDRPAYMDVLEEVDNGARQMAAIRERWAVGRGRPDAGSRDRGEPGARDGEAPLRGLRPMTEPMASTSGSVPAAPDPAAAGASRAPGEGVEAAIPGPERSAGRVRDLPADPSTGLEGPAAWTRILETENARLLRYGRPVTVVVAELEGVHRVADRLGDEAASRLVRVAAEALRREARGSDWVARIGETRFAALLPETDEVQALNYVERVRLATRQWLASSATPLRLAVGWASPPPAADLEFAVRRAEDRMNADRRVHEGRRES